MADGALNPTGIVIAVMLVIACGPAALRLKRRLRRLEPAPPDDADRFTAIGVGLVIAFGALLAEALVDACFTTIDVHDLVTGFDAEWRFGVLAPVQRGGLGLEMAALLRLAGLSPLRWGLVILAVHIVNAGLVFALARGLGVERRWAVVAWRSASCSRGPRQARCVEPGLCVLTYGGRCRPPGSAFRRRESSPPP
jgi:hypothetical protein